MEFVKQIRLSGVEANSEMETPVVHVVMGLSF